MVKLARDAATGAIAVRGGSDHSAAQFTVRSCFLFSSILIPPLLPQDRSRMAILELDELDKDVALPDVSPKRMGELGAQLLRRLIDGWPRAAATLVTTPLEVAHDRRRMSVGRWVAFAAGKFSDGPDPATANLALQEVGLKVVSEAGRMYLAVANTHRGLDRIFDNTQWAGRPGAQGVWVQSLRRLPHHIPRGANGKPKTVWIGAVLRATFFPIELCLPVSDAELRVAAPDTGGPLL